MKQDRLAQCLGDIDNKYINEAEQYKRAKQRPAIKWAAIAACLCLVVAAAVYIGLSAAPGGSEHSLGNAPPVTESGALSPSGDPTDSPGGNHALLVPAIELPENTSGVEMDMIGLVVYKGRIYTQAKTYIGSEALAIGSLVGEKLAYATGNIDEWSKQSDYEVELASSISGDIYSVNGYSSDFRICMKGYYEEEDGAQLPYVYFLENLNNIGLTTGKDLFGERLGLLGNVSHARYLEHDSWNNGWPSYVFLEPDGVTCDDITAFIEALYEGGFEYVYDENDSLGFYSRSARQAHLYLHLEDGTIIELRLFEGGYVGYQHLGWYFVKMPGEIFDLIFNACL